LSIAGEDFGVFLVEHGRVDLGHGVGDFLLAGPDIAQVDGFAVVVRPQRILGQVDAHAAGQRVGHYQRRRGQPVGLDQGVHAAFEVAVAREDRRDREVGAGDGFFDGFVQWP